MELTQIELRLINPFDGITFNVVVSYLPQKYVSELSTVRDCVESCEEKGQLTGGYPCLRTSY